MSIGSLGIVGSLASTPLAQKGTEADKAQRQAVEHSLQADSQSRAESAAGIGQTEEESQASERDADGRRLWERQGDQSPAEETPVPAAADAAATSAKDPSGDRGNLLDLEG